MACTTHRTQPRIGAAFFVNTSTIRWVSVGPCGLNPNSDCLQLLYIGTEVAHFGRQLTQATN